MVAAWQSAHSADSVRFLVNHDGDRRGARACAAQVQPSTASPTCARLLVWGVFGMLQVEAVLDV